MPCSIKQILSAAADKLNKIGISSSQLEARILLQHAINKPIEYLLVNPDKQLNQSELETFETALERRLKHEPIAYILGRKEFYSREFIVNKHVLIPRADTELLVEIVLGLLKSSLRATERSVAISGMLSKIASSTPMVSSRNDECTKIFELGTGSGCLAISLLLELPNSKVTATDISIDAIEVAKNNAVKHEVLDRLQIIHSDWFKNLESQKFDLIISNPPYISETEKSEMALETINYEPHIALFAEEDGLQAYRIIAENAKKFLKPAGKIILEIGFNQADKVSKIFLDYGYNIDNIHKDLQSHSRVIEISHVYTADTSKTPSQISGEHAQRILNVAHRRIPKFDVPNLEVSKVYLNRSYARRIGKSLSNLQQNLLDNELPKYLFSKEKLINEERKIFLEIGFGMGEHFINQAKLNPEAVFIGVEVYLNGVANVLKLACEQHVTNFLLFPNNLDFILNDLPNNSLAGIYILFPDPWIKNKQKKKRIFNKERLKILQTKLKNNSSLVFASDIENYFYEVVELIKQNNNFQIINEDDYLKSHDNYVITKYHQKALDAGRQARFLIATIHLINEEWVNKDQFGKENGTYINT